MSKFNLCNITTKLSIDDEDRVYQPISTNSYYTYTIKLIKVVDITKDNKIILVFKENIKCKGSHVYWRNMYSDDDIKNMLLVASRDNYATIDLDTIIDKKYIHVYAKDLHTAINEDKINNYDFFDEWYIENEENDERIGLDCIEGLDYYRIVRDMRTHFIQNNLVWFSAKVYIDTDANEKNLY